MTAVQKLIEIEKSQSKDETLRYLKSYIFGALKSVNEELETAISKADKSYYKGQNDAFHFVIERILEMGKE